MPILFTCPHCGVNTNVADQYAGQSGPCAQCGKMVTIPGSSSFGPMEPPRRGLSTGWIVFIILVCVGGVLLVCGGLLAAMLLPAVGSAREAARRAQCTNNLRQIGLAIHNYAQANKCLPPAYVADKNGKPLYSWRVLILPYMESDYIYQQFHLNEPWDSPHNRALTRQMPAVFRCPTAFDTGSGSTTCYAMVVGPHAFGHGSKPRNFGDIKDGLSNSIMLVEAVGAQIPWAAPEDVSIDDIQSIQNVEANAAGKTKGISSCHPGIAHVAIADGSVRAIYVSTDPKTLKALLTIDGGEAVDPDTF